MKQLLSKLCDYMKQLLSSKTCMSMKKFITSGVRKLLKRLLPKKTYKRVMPFLSSRLCKMLVLVFFLILVLTIGLSRCSADQSPSMEPVIGSVSSDTLDVHKKPQARSRILGQLPMDLEVEILEEKIGSETIWGRIDKTKLPSGKKVKGGWIDLQHVSFGDEPVTEIPEEISEAEPEVMPVTVTMGTITAGKLNIRKGPGSEYEKDGAYYKGDRVEILETKTVDDTVWGRTSQGWVGMGYVRMDGTYTSDNDPDRNPNAPAVTSNGNLTVLGYGIVTLKELNVRFGPDMQYSKVRTASIGTRYAYYQLVDGWARIEDGWVSTDHFYVEGTITDDAFPGIVKTEELNVRTGPSTRNKLVDTYKQGESIEIYAKFGEWGYSDKGWVHLDYVGPNYVTGTGIVANGLNIRLEPSADSEAVGTYTTGDRVTILEVRDSWGRTDLGWIHLKSVIYDTSPLSPTVPVTP